MGELCGAARRARTGDAAKITGYLGDDATFDAAFSAAADEKRIPVERGV